MIEDNNEYEQLDQQMLELVYELLPKDEAAALKHRIAEEPEVAAAFARAEREAGVFAAAAKWHEAPIPMRSAECGVRNVTEVQRTKDEGRSIRAGDTSHVALQLINNHGQNRHGDPVPPEAHSTFPIRHSPFGVAGLRRTVQWAVGIAATVLFAFLLGGYLHHRGRLSEVAARHLRVTVTGPSQLVAGVDNYFQVKTTDVLGKPQSVRLECALSDAWGNKLVSEDVRTNAEGLFKLAVPADISLPLAARLEVLAFHQDEAYRLEAAVPHAPYRFISKLSTDKPLYRPGEIVRFRSLTLGRFGLDVPGDFPVHFEIHDPAGSVVAGSEAQGITQRGVGNGEFQLPADRAGGEYKLVARSLNEAFPEEKRSFFVREYRTPALKKDLEFTRDSYSPGDRVLADFSVNKAQGGPAAGAQLTFTATVDGQTVHEASDKASAGGTFRIEFELPKSIERGNAQLAIRVDDGGTQETIAKTIPINLGKVDVKFYPEGGDLVAGLENRVYFAACDPLGKPAHVEGTIVDDAGQKVVQFETRHKGMGLFACTPKQGSTYHVRLTKPAEVKTESKLPPVSEERSVVLSTGRGVFEPDKPIEAELCSTEAERPMVVAAYCRGMQVGQTSVTTKLGKSAVTIPVPEGVGGVIRLTVFDYSKRDGVEKSADSDSKGPRAVAERLVYRRPDRRLSVAVADHSEQYAPGDKVELSLIATNENGQPAKSAVLGLAVVDDSLLKLADDDSPAMPTHFYLTSEVEKPEDLEKADFYLSDDTKADEALDLLLGTQGWRRFVERTFEDLQQKAKEAGQPVKPEQPVERLLALGGAALPPTVLDNFDDVRRQYDEARSQADADYRAAVAQLSRAAVFGGLLLGGLLVAINVAPLIRRPGEWSWLVISRRFGPAAVVVGLCVLVGVLWMPKATNLAESDLVAWQEFKLQLPKLTEPGSESRHAKLLKGLDAQNLNRLSRNWYWSRGDRWGDADFALQLGEQEFAYFDLYGLDWRDKALKFGKRTLGDVELEFLPGLEQIVIRGHPRDADRVEGIIQQIEALGVDGYRILYPTPDAWADFGRERGRYIQLTDRDGALSKWGAYQNGWHYANKQRLGFQIDGEVAAADYDAFLKQYKVQIEQLRFPVREYAHQHTAGEPGVRSDFTETVCWNPLLVTDENGRASISFDLADSITSYRVMTEAHDGAGRIGTGNGVVIAKLPFVIDPKLPLEVNAGDRIEIPVAVTNESVRSLEAALSCKVGGKDDVTPSVPTTMGLFKLIGDAEQQVTVSAGSMARTYFTLDVVGQMGTADVEVHGAAGTHADAKRQAIRVVPPGFPVAESYAGRLAGEQEVTIAVPESVVPGTLEVTLAAYPSTIATLQSGLEGVLREPSGCFEQASSSNYPNLLLLQYLEENKVSQPELTRKGKEYLKSGYTKLTGYECPSKGFEWFGADPGHEALTAYGLLEFRDMARVHDVDAKLLDRTAEWLLARRDGKGGFQRNDKKLDGFGAAPAQITNAYIVWALSESGQQGIDNELTQSIDHARRSSDPYEVALAAASAVNCNREADGRALLGKLTTLQGADGQLVGTEGSITRSGGAALAVETTALAALAWLKVPEFRAQANRAIDWIIKNRSGDGSFGSTQATILALKALVEHAKASHGSVTGGELIVKHGDAVIGTQKFAADEVNTIKLADFEGKLTSGENHLTISLTGENQMPYTIDVSYRARRPQSHPDCAVQLSTKLTSTEIKAGETVALEAEVSNKTEQGQPMTVAILGLPAGLQPRADQLEELKKAGTIDYYETRAREVICYWRSLAPKQRVPIKLDLVAEWPGRYTAPASRAYLYYTAEQKQWVEPLAVEIKR